MNNLRALVLLGAVCAGASSALGENRVAPVRPNANEQDSVAAWALAHPKVRALTGGNRTRVLRTWSHVPKGGGAATVTVVLRDYDAGVTREITADRAGNRVEAREVLGVQPSGEEMAEGMAIVRRDPALATLVGRRELTLMGGFHNRSTHRDDPCAKDVCLEFAFMKPGWEKGPARYVVVNLSRRLVANRDFRARPGEGRPRMTEPSQ